MIDDRSEKEKEREKGPIEKGFRLSISCWRMHFSAYFGAVEAFRSCFSADNSSDKPWKYVKCRTRYKYPLPDGKEEMLKSGEAAPPVWSAQNPQQKKRKNLEKKRERERRATLLKLVQ